VKCFSFAEKYKAMMDKKFEHICAMICDDRWEESKFTGEEDNMFYENFGMSGAEILRLLARDIC